MHRFGIAFAVSSLAVASAATSGASAQFVNGQVIQGRYYYPNINTPYNDPLYDFTRTLVDGTDFTSGYDSGWRFDFVGNRFRIDFFLPSDASYFYFDLADGHTFNGYTLKDLRHDSVVRGRLGRRRHAGQLVAGAHRRERRHAGARLPAARPALLLSRRLRRVRGAVRAGAGCARAARARRRRRAAPRAVTAMQWCDSHDASTTRPLAR